MRGAKALEEWSKAVTSGYPGVEIRNLTSSWRDGLGFCAIIHHYRPDLIDFCSLHKEDVFYNNNLAFTIAQKELGVTSLLEAEDMLHAKQLDRNSILLYLSELYLYFEVVRSMIA